MYGKVFRQMYKGSMSRQGWESIVTMQQFIVLADRHGVVDMTLEAIAAETTIPIEVLRKGVEILAAPDTGSRTPDDDGRRIVPLDDRRDWGWQLVNYEKYRKIQSEEDRREYQRAYWHVRKEKKKTQQHSTDSIHAEVDAEVDAKTIKNLPTVGARKRASRRCPDDWKPSPEDVAKISRECPDVDMAAAERKFRDHEFSKARSDWAACWRNWMRTDQERSSKANKPRPTRYEELMARSKLPGPSEPSAVALFLAGGKA
jgi:hypothetical protein